MLVLVLAVALVGLNASQDAVDTLELPVPLNSGSSECRPVAKSQTVIAVVRAASPRLDESLTLARAMIADAAPFAFASEAITRQALHAEGGLRRRRGQILRARALIERAEQSFSELEDRAALELVAQATPLLVAAQMEPEALDLLAQAHLLAGAVFVARQRLDAATRRLQRALDLKPTVTPAANLRLVGALEAVRARSTLRGHGTLVVKLVDSGTTAEVFIDGRGVGPAPARFERLPAGRHLVRVSSPERRSHAGTIVIEPTRDTYLAAHLPKDPVRARFRALARRLSVGHSLRDAQFQLTQRAEVDRSLVAALIPSPRRGEQGELATAVLLDLEGSGRRRVDRLDREAIAAALRDLAECSSRAVGIDARALVATPPLPAVLPPRLGPIGPTPAPEPPWRSPWFWTLVSLAAIGLAGGLAAAHGANAAPDQIAITLIPRP